MRVFLALASLAGLTLPVATLDGKERSFPQDAAATRAVFVVTFTKAASEQGSGWSRQLNELHAKLGAEVFQVAVLEDVPRLFRSMAVSGIARQVPAALHDHFWIATSRSKGWRQLTGEGPAKEAHVFVLDGRSRIVWRAHGACSEARLREIQALPAP